VKDLSRIILSKSRILRGLQCEKALHLGILHPELEPRPDASQQAVFDLGHQVGLEARKLFPTGVLIDAKPWEQHKAAEQTRIAIERGATAIFEATFLHEGKAVRIDILRRETRHEPWELIEVKASTSVKAEHRLDVAIQSWILKLLGVEHERCILMHINSKCVAPDLSELFVLEDITQEVAGLMTGLPDQVERMRKSLGERTEPPMDIGRHCFEPHECPFVDYCFAQKQIPDLSVFDLYLIKDRVWDLYREGIVSLEDPRLSELTETQSRMVAVFKSGERFVDRRRIRETLSQWAFPRYFLDFETVGSAIPRYPGTSPYEQVPFQFSCHIQLEAGGSLLHHEYLHDSDTDPRRGLTAALLDAISPGGSVVSYNKKFEGKCLEALAKQFPERAAALGSIIDRLVDPLPLIREAVYDHGFRGSFSIKAVAPALLGDRVSYDGMRVADGGTAPIAFAEMIGAATLPQRRLWLREGLLEYCKKDTLNMVLLIEWLEQQ
jgi:hypothetical protein